MNAIDILYGQSTDNFNFHNPVSELITPEWHYSDSSQVLDNTQINWENLVEFERSFCSWYQSYHYLPREKWGMHLRYDSRMRIAALFYHNCQSVQGRKIDSIKSAFLYLYVHDLFHNIVENAASVMELLLGKSHVYTKYYSNVYSNVFNSPNCIEEALSNGYLFLWAEECHIDRYFLNDELLKQGPGYRNFVQYTGSNFSKGNRI